jgi:hypothetical protein
VNLRKTGTQFGNTGQGWGDTFVLGDQLWFRDGQQVFEVVDGRLNSSTFTPPPKWTAPESFFIWNGKPAFVADETYGFVVSTLESAGWMVAGKITLPGAEKVSGTVHILVPDTFFAPVPA